MCVLVVASIIGAGTVARVQAIGANHRISLDEHGYILDANHILHGHPWYASFKWSPGTPLLFAAATRLESQPALAEVPNRATPAQHAQLAVEVVTLVVIALVAWAIAGPLAAMLAVALSASYVPLVLMTTTYLSEPLGGLALTVAVSSVALTRQRSTRHLALAGVAGGICSLCREDVLPVVLVLGAYLAVSTRPRWRRGAQRGVLYIGCALATVAPWCVYASVHVGEPVPITSSGPSALFIGTYLPADGKQRGTVMAFAPAVCRAYPTTCGQAPAYGTGPMFLLIRRRYRVHDPRISTIAAARKAALHNLRAYALGRPVSFLGMLARKYARGWGAWGGINSHRQINLPQHLVYLLLAALGLVGGALSSGRWSLRAAALAVVTMSVVNALFIAQSRANVRMDPLLLLYGSCGMVLLGRRLTRAGRPRRPLRRRGLARDRPSAQQLDAELGRELADVLRRLEDR
jgi:hypothetical protein